VRHAPPPGRWLATYRPPEYPNTQAIMPTSPPDIAVIIPHFQRRPGLLSQAVRSAFAQTLADRVLVIVCDDGSPSPAQEELDACEGLPRHQLKVVRQANAGAGAARNNALNNVPTGIRFAAFLDSDDLWRPHHLERAVQALERGYDAYFADFVAVGYPGVGNMERIGTLKAPEHRLLEGELRLHELSVSALEHIVSDGGGLIQTSTVVYRFDRFATLRFREEFFNGQDFFFWMDLGEQGARFAFSFDIECDNGEGVNIYQASGWGSEKSLQRIRNELFVWTSVERFYRLDARMKAANRRTIRNLQDALGKDILHRLRHRKPIAGHLVADIIRMAPSTLLVAPLAMVKTVLGHASR
jgi:succinoglycan biosynthesis protein ExoW